MNIEIFRAGTYRGKEYGRDFLDKIARSYDPGYHEAPAVIGHPKENAPAYGWTKSLKVVGDTLIAELDDATLDKQFVELVSGGKFKKRSASFYLDLNGKGPYLRHVGFLGAMPPEVKGLKDVEFKEGGQLLEVELSEISTAGRLFRRLRDWMIDKEGLETADKVLWDWDIQTLESDQQNYREIKNDPPTADKEKESDMDEAKVRELIAENTKQVEARFAEQIKAKDAEIVALRAKDGERDVAARKREIKDFCEKHKETIVPAWRKAGIEEFMERLDAVEDDKGAPLEVEFGEKKEKQTLRGWFESFIESLPKVLDLTERAKGDGAGASAGNQLIALAEQYLADMQSEGGSPIARAAVTIDPNTGENRHGLGTTDLGYQL